VKCLEDLLEEKMWSRGLTSTYPLITAQPHEVLVRDFQNELLKRQIDWQPALQLTSLELVRSYAEKGFGAGLTVVTPGIQLPDTHRYLILKDFPPLKIGLIYRGKPKQITLDFIELTKLVADKLR